MANTCEYTGCGRKAHAFGYCRLHATRIKKHGSPDGGVNCAPIEERFWRYVVKDTGTDCWDWSGAKNINGYARIGRNGRGTGVEPGHRLSYRMHNGQIPEGMIVMHKCDNPPCTNPEHLRLGTMKENTQDMLSKGRGRWAKNGSTM